MLTVTERAISTPYKPIATCRMAVDCPPTVTEEVPPEAALAVGVSVTVSSTSSTRLREE